MANRFKWDKHPAFIYERSLMEKVLEQIKESITKTQKELSNFNIDDDYGKKENVDKKVEVLKLKVKKKFETIYEDSKEDNLYDLNNNKSKRLEEPELKYN